MTLKYALEEGRGAALSGTKAVVLGLVLSGAVFASGCATQPKLPPQPQNAAGEIRDVEVIPQNLSVFARQAGGR